MIASGRAVGRTHGVSDRSRLVHCRGVRWHHVRFRYRSRARFFHRPRDRRRLRAPARARHAHRDPATRGQCAARRKEGFTAGHHQSRAPARRRRGTGDGRATGSRASRRCAPARRDHTGRRIGDRHVGARHGASGPRSARGSGGRNRHATAHRGLVGRARAHATRCLREGRHCNSALVHRRQRARQDRHAGAVRRRRRAAEVCDRPGLAQRSDRTAPRRHRRGGDRRAGVRLARAHPAARSASCC